MLQEKKNLNKIFFIIILIWPFVFLFPLSFGFIVMGNDFELIYFSYKRYIAEMLSVGVIPYWSPVEGSGMSLIYNPFAQYFYIPGWINYLIYFVTDNLTLHTYLNYTIFGLSIFSLGIFKWLRSFKININYCLIAAIIIVCNLKLTELLRFPNAVHSAAWFPWILYGINSLTFYKKYLKGFLVIFFSNLFLLTAGYPYFIIYSVFIFIFYIGFACPWLFNYERNVSKFKIISNIYIKNSIPFILSYLIALPWLLKVRTFLKNLVDRTENNWEFSTEHTFSWIDTLGSWLFPPAASTEGWYYSGILISILVIFLITLIFKKDFINKQDLKLILFSIFFISFITYFSWVESSLLFKWSWNNIPLIGSLRTWPRLNITLLPFIALLFAFSLKYIEKILKENKEIYYSLFKFFIIFLIFLSIQLYFNIFEIKNQEYWGFWQKIRFDYAIKNVPQVIGNFINLYNGKIYIIFNIISLFGIYIIFYFKEKIFSSKFKLLIGIFLILTIASELFVISNLQWGLDKWKTNYVKTLNPLNELRLAFNKKRIIDTVKGNEYFRDKKKFNINYPDNYGYNSHAIIFTKYFQRYGGKKNLNVEEEEIYYVRKFFGNIEPYKKIFFSKKLNHENITSFIKDSDEYEKSANFSYEVLMSKYDGNKIEFNISTQNKGWVSFIDNWDYDWEAYIDNKKVKIYKLLNSYKAIQVKKGFSNIKFQYKPL